MTERPPAEDELLVDDGDEIAGDGTQLALPLQIDLDPASLGPRASTIPGEATPPRAGAEQRARFVAEAQPLGSDGRVALEPSDDDPTVAFRPPGPDERDIDATVRLRRSPPALPPPLHPPEAAPNVWLGPGFSALGSRAEGPRASTRSEATDRAPPMPKTHPMANSIAPGGSALTMTPPPKPASRGLFAAAAAALLLLGVGAAHYLRSPGEHHAATEHGGRDAPRAAAMPAVEALADAPATPAPARPSNLAPAAAPPHAATAVEARGPSAREPRNDIAHVAPQAPPPRAAPSPAVRAEPAAPAAPGPIKAALGEAALSPAGRPFRPTLGQIAAAVEGVRDQVSACAGGAHGIADVVLRVQASGAVTHVLVQSGPFADSPAGSCIARALRKARVAPFGKPVVHVLYTLQI